MDGAFSECTGLQQVRLPANLRRISDRLFHDCRALSRVPVPDSVRSVGVNAFYGCTSLKEIDFSACEIDYIGSRAFFHVSPDCRIITSPGAEQKFVSGYAFNSPEIKLVTK